MRISVCVCTYKRPVLLAALLRALARQTRGGRFDYRIIVADNDRQRSAQPVVQAALLDAEVPIDYVVEPEQNIALVRNKALAQADGDFVAFIDDDEIPQPDWLLTAWQACERFGADGVLAPVRPYFEHAPPAWLIKGRFCERPEHATGHRLQWRETRTGNVLLRRRLLDGQAEPFQRRYGNGGEDQDFFRRLIESGARFVWCREAAVYELVPPERCRRRYLLKRALLRGQNETGLTDLRGIAKSIVAVPVYTLALPFLLAAGQHRFMQGLVRLCDHTGKLVGVLGFRPLGDKYIVGG